jgi:hypothetical protein
MKDIKSYVIGFLTCACLFLIMGQTKSDSKIGRYQISTSQSKMNNEGVLGVIIDTRTGAVYKKTSYAKHHFIK